MVAWQHLNVLMRCGLAESRKCNWPKFLLLWSDVFIGYDRPWASTISLGDYGPLIYSLHLIAREMHSYINRENVHLMCSSYMIIQPNSDCIDQRLLASVVCIVCSYSSAKSIVLVQDCVWPSDAWWGICPAKSTISIRDYDHLIHTLNTIAQLRLRIRFLLVLFRARRHHPVTHQVRYLMTYGRHSGRVLNCDLMNLRSERNEPQYSWESCRSPKGIHMIFTKGVIPSGVHGSV